VPWPPSVVWSRRGSGGPGSRCASSSRWTTRPAPRCCGTWPPRSPIPAAARRASCPAAWAGCRWRCTCLGSPFARWSTFAGYREALDGVELPAALTDIEEQGADIHANVQRTWDLSLDALAAEGRPQARPLLLVLSCFAPATPIPAWLLQLPPLAGLLAGQGEQRDLRAGLQGLSRTGLIDISNAGSPAGVPAVTVHPVVADANRIRLAASTAAEHTAVPETAVALLEAATAGLDPVRPGDWPTCGC
jgi:hypothetical protein